MSFFNNLSKYGTVRAKPGVWVPKDPRDNFVANALKQIEHIDSGSTPDSGNAVWFKVERDGSYVVTLRNGIRVIPVGGSKQTQMVCRDKDAAIEYLGDAIQAAENGEFDALFEATKVTFKNRGARAAVPPPAQEPEHKPSVLDRVRAKTLAKS